jgi:hypothetical protein
MDGCFYQITCIALRGENWRQRMAVSTGCIYFSLSLPLVNLGSQHIKNKIVRDETFSLKKDYTCQSITLLYQHSHHH